MLELEKYGGMFDCQRYRDVIIYSLSAFSFAMPQAVEVLAEATWRPRLMEEEVGPFLLSLPPFLIWNLFSSHFCPLLQLEMERQGIRFELEDVNSGLNNEPLLVDMIHQASMLSTLEHKPWF